MIAQHISFEIGDRVQIERGRFFGRTGTIKRRASIVFADYVYVTLHPQPRERVMKTEMIERAALVLLPMEQRA